MELGRDQSSGPHDPRDWEKQRRVGASELPQCDCPGAHDRQRESLSRGPPRRAPEAPGLGSPFKTETLPRQCSGPAHSSSLAFGKSNV
ncbi:hypothetical protein P7K49_017693 [Saguinus oedipus]|uniref:Uncharacterized protein n=1 Tax=Saguinus oedipus TaxID=9490 RepID=A0ABQ9V5X1_SAGOE|nr:hypothetical protein P7K49_017693 [Saguinus oedipus]